MRLSEWQNRFVDALVSPEKQPAFEGLVGAELASRIEIYHGSVQQALVNTLRNTYPHTLGILGDDCFNQYAQQYAALNPMVAVNLNFYGGGFPIFLGQALVLAVKQDNAFEGFEYLTDFAALEWYCHRAYYAADSLHCQPISAMSSLNDDEQMNVSLKLAADISLLKSSYPLHRIWNNLSDIAQADPPANNQQEAHQYFYYLIQRQGFRGRPTQISVAHYQLLEALDNGDSLGELVALEMDLSPLESFISYRWVVGFTIKAALKTL